MSLEQQGYQHIQHPVSMQATVQHTATVWREFIENTPQEVKNQLASNGLQNGVGYEQKLGDGTRQSGDMKQNFDVTRAGLPSLKKHAIPEYQSLLDASTSLLQQLEPLADDFSRYYLNPLTNDDFYELSATRFVRFLYYPPQPEGTVIGQAHTDHSAYTFHLYESTGGCHNISLEDGLTWNDLPVTPDQMLAFGGMQLQLASKGTVKALCHEITANDHTAAVGRYAIVCFNLIPSLPTYDRALQGRLQNKPAGFNYVMPHGAFEKLFTLQ